MHSFAAPWPGAAAAGERSSVLGAEAQPLLLCAMEAVQQLGGATLAQGWQQWRGRGPPPSHLVRDVRQLDAAAALLRHPGSADALLRRLEAWLEAEVRGSISAGYEEVAGYEGDSGKFIQQSQQVNEIMGQESRDLVRSDPARPPQEADLFYVGEVCGDVGRQTDALAAAPAGSYCGSVPLTFDASSGAVP
jgi:hypothetical protein